jgi:hypothetical protein
MAMFSKKESAMGFETVVLGKVAKIVKSDNMASFFCGTLSVICTESQARKIYHQLSKDYGLGKVQISRDGSYGYCFDFVA